MSALAKLRELELAAEPLDMKPAKLDEPLPTYSNIARVLDAIGKRIRFEEFTGRIMCAELGPDGEWTDAHTTLLVELCESMKLYVTPAAIDRAVEKHAKHHAYNALTDFAERCALAWDGTPRVDQALST